MTTEERVKAIIEDKLYVDKSEITDNANLADDLGADSLDQIELVMELEKEFDITIPDEDFDGIATVGEVVEYMKKAVTIE